MFKFIAKIIFLFFSNLVAIAAAVYFIPGFKVATDLKSFLIVVGIFTLINMFIRPILKLLFGPIILLTFGIGILVINAVLLGILDFVSNNVSISGLIPLLYATVLIGAVNLILAFSAKSLFRSDN